MGRLLGLIAVLLALGALLWWSGRKDPQKPIDLRAVLGGRSLADAEHVAFRRSADLAPIELARGDDLQWRVVEPVRDRASTAFVQAMQSAFDKAQLVPAYPADQVTPALLAETGLATPEGELTAHWSGGETVVLQIGLQGPLGHDLFARRAEPGADGRIDRVDRSLLNALQANVHEVRDPFVFGMGPDLASRVRIERGGVAPGTRDVLALERDDAGRFLITEPKALRADPARAYTLISALLALRVLEFVPGDPSASAVGPDSPFDAVIEIGGSLGAERLELRFLKESERMIGRIEPRGVWFAAPLADFAGLIEVPARELRARWLIEVPIDDAQVIRITPHGMPPFELLRDGLGQFKVARPITCPVDAAAMAELLQAFRSLSALEFVVDEPKDLVPYGLDAACVVELEGPRGSGGARIGADGGEDLAYAMPSGEGQVVAIPRIVAQRLRRPVVDYVERRLLALESAAAIGAIRRTTQDGASVAFARGADGSFTRDGVPVDPAFEASLDALRDLRGETVLPRDAITGATPAGRLVVEAPTGQLHLDVELFVGQDGRALCTTARLPGVVFRLSARDGRDLLALK
ncbi:MAG: DUF4340 domain-containing protein [Planctomycetes bacterium]|nr:DUF4340 domain-containing protein [Planctomycetota bacterium]